MSPTSLTVLTVLGSVKILEKPDQLDKPHMPNKLDAMNKSNTPDKSDKIIYKLKPKIKLNTRSNKDTENK